MEDKERELECNPAPYEGKNIFKIIKWRWKAKIPIFFKWVMGLGTTIAAVALAVQMSLNSAGAVTPQWWEDIYPYLIGIGAGMTATAKFTQQPPCEPK